MIEPTYREKFEVVLLHIANGNSELVEDLKQYLMHTRRFGRQAANNKYPHCHNLKIDNKEVRQAWKLILRKLEKLGK